MLSNLITLKQDLQPGHSRLEISSGHLGTAQTIEKMKLLVERGKRDFRVRKIIGPIIEQCNHKDYFCYADATHNWIRENIKYTYDPVNVELIESPYDILQSRHGDCDSQVMLFCTIMESIGLPCRFVTVRGNPNSNEFTHVYSEVNIPGQGWTASDTTMPNGFGWSPPQWMPRKEWPVSTQEVSMLGHCGCRERHMDFLSGLMGTRRHQPRPVFRQRKKGHVARVFEQAAIASRRQRGSREDFLSDLIGFGQDEDQAEAPAEQSAAYKLQQQQYEAAAADAEKRQQAMTERQEQKEAQAQEKMQQQVERNTAAQEAVERAQRQQSGDVQEQRAAAEEQQAVEEQQRRVQEQQQAAAAEQQRQAAQEQQRLVQAQAAQQRQTQAAQQRVASARLERAAARGQTAAAQAEIERQRVLEIARQRDAETARQQQAAVEAQRQQEAQRQVQEAAQQRAAFEASGARAAAARSRGRFRGLGAEPDSNLIQIVTDVYNGTFADRLREENSKLNDQTQTLNKISQGISILPPDKQSIILFARLRLGREAVAGARQKLIEAQGKYNFLVSELNRYGAGLKVSSLSGIGFLPAAILSNLAIFAGVALAFAAAFSIAARAISGSASIVSDVKDLTTAAGVTIKETGTATAKIAIAGVVLAGAYIAYSMFKQRKNR